MIRMLAAVAPGAGWGPLSSDQYQCAPDTCEGTDSDVIGLYVDLQNALGTPADGTLRAADLTAYNAVASRYGLPSYLNLYDLAANAPGILHGFDVGVPAATPGFGPTAAFWGFLGVSVVIVGGVFYAGRRGYFDRRLGRTRRGRYK